MIDLVLSISKKHAKRYVNLLRSREVRKNKLYMFLKKFLGQRGQGLH